MAFDGYPSRHFSLANRFDGRHPTDLPHLLRRVANRIEKYDIRPMDILDVTIHQEMTGDGPWWDVTVYWSPGDEDEQPPPRHDDASNLAP